jgi:hypothetical protein
MNNFYNSPDLWLLQKNGVNVAGTLQLNGEECASSASISLYKAKE